MSRRVTTQTQITDRELAIDAFKAAGANYRETTPGTFSLTVGRSGGTLNLKTGTIEGDSDNFSDKDFDSLRQNYAHQKLLWELRRQGGTVDSSAVDRQGRIVVEYTVG